MNFPGIEGFLKKYQAQAKDAGTDPLGFYQPPFAYAAMQVLEQAIKATGSLDDDKLADYIHKNAFNTIVGEIRFNELGEWATARMLVVQFQNVQRQRARAVHDRQQAGHRVPAAVQGRRAGGAVREIAAGKPTGSPFMQITAAVVREKFGAFTIDTLELTDPRPDEVLVRIVASGMCQTDQHGRDGYYNTPYPAVYGHEGAGMVQAVGSGVTTCRGGRSRGDLISLVRRLSELPARHAVPLHAAVST